MTLEDLTPQSLVSDGSAQALDQPSRPNHSSSHDCRFWRPELCHAQADLKVTGADLFVDLST
jgi:hypothetical protein